MPNALLLHLNDPADAIVATSLIKRLAKDGFTVYCVSNEVSEPVFEFSGGTNLSVDQARKGSFDVAVNLSPSFLCADIMNNIRASKKLGYGVTDEQISFFNDGAKAHYETVHLGKVTKANLFQLMYGIADITWQGEGYGLSYFPRNKTRKGLTGLATKDVRLREFLISNLSLEWSRLWQIPFKKNVLKHIDETNRCKQVVTDDMTTLHVALALRKNVEYVIQRELPYKVEMFGSGNVHVYDPAMIKSSVNRNQNAT